MKCPYCGGEYDPPELRADLDTNHIEVNGERIKAPPKAVEMFSELLSSYPGVAYKERMILRVWGYDGGPEDVSIVSVYMSMLRRFLTGKGWRIDNHQPGKYCLRRT